MDATVYPKKYAHGFVVLCFVVVMQSFIMNSREVFFHIHQGCFAGTGAIVRLPQCQWSKPDGYGIISQCITTTKHSKAKTCAYFLGYTVHDLTDDKSTIIQVMAWCHQATSHYLRQCWPKSMSPYGITRPQWVNTLLHSLGIACNKIYLLWICEY